MHKKVFIVTEYGIPSITEILKPYSPNRLAAMSATWRYCKAFDEVRRYEPRPESLPKFSAIEKILAQTVYNPSAGFEVGWVESGPYQLIEIKEEIIQGLEKDDDIIQQWFDASDVVKLLQSAHSFEALTDSIRCICGEHETDERLQKIINTIL